MHALEQINPIHILTARINSLEKAMREMQESKAGLHAQIMQIKNENHLQKSKELIMPDGEKYLGNSAENVDRRYRVWQILHENGYSASSIARAWGMDHTSVIHAKQNGWRSKCLAK